MSNFVSLSRVWVCSVQAFACLYYSEFGHQRGNLESKQIKSAPSVTILYIEKQSVAQNIITEAKARDYADKNA